MSTVRIAVASTPLTATLEEAVPAAVAAIEEAGRLGAQIVCLPETGLPGHRDQARPVPDVTERRDRCSPRRGRGRRTREPGSSRSSAPSGRRRPAAEIVSVVFGADGTPSRRAGQDPDRPDRGAATTSPERGRRVFTATGADVRHRDLPRGVPLPGDRALARPRRCPGRLRPALRDDRRRLAAGPLVRCVQSVQREGAHVPGAREHRLRRRVERGRTRPGFDHRHHRARRDARREPALRRGRRRLGRHRSRPEAPTGCSPGAGRRGGICSRPWPRQP